MKPLFSVLILAVILSSCEKSEPVVEEVHNHDEVQRKLDRALQKIEMSQSRRDASDPVEKFRLEKAEIEAETQRKIANLERERSRIEHEERLDAIFRESALTRIDLKEREHEVTADQADQQRRDLIGASGSDIERITSRHDRIPSPPTDPRLPAGIERAKNQKNIPLKVGQ